MQIKKNNQSTELLAPAGNIESAFAAFNYGADAIFVGLKKFSARAEADNFTVIDLKKITYYAHNLNKKVYLTINTLIKECELNDLIKTLFYAHEAKVDAIIVQDLSIVNLIKNNFPNISIHASTQMSIHNLEGVLAMEKLGFSRVVLARELSFKEIKFIKENSNIELECFVHGALCYSYSGLCLFSSVNTGRSGNRGRCVYPCREVCFNDNNSGHIFSLNDLALTDKIKLLSDIGVDSLKIEGRKKSYIYVSAAVNLYRNILDSKLSHSDLSKNKKELKTIFTRPWTELFFNNNQNINTTDLNIVGHRGSASGKILSVKSNLITFKTNLPIEIRDGIQIDLPYQEKPFGFSIKTIKIIDRNKKYSVLKAEENTIVELELPNEHPLVEKNYAIYISSSQAVKQKYNLIMPNKKITVEKQYISLYITLKTNKIVIIATFQTPDIWYIEDIKESEVYFEKNIDTEKANNLTTVENIAKTNMSKLGDTSFCLLNWSFNNQEEQTIKTKEWNNLRRDIVEILEEKYDLLRKKSLEKVVNIALKHMPEEDNVITNLSDEIKNQNYENLDTKIINIDFNWRKQQALNILRVKQESCWSILVDDISYLDFFNTDDFKNIEEVILNIPQIEDDSFYKKLQSLIKRINNNKIRLSLPTITREWQTKYIIKHIKTLIDLEYRNWMLSNLSGLELLPYKKFLNLAANWQISCLNTKAIEELKNMGFSWITISPESDKENTQKILDLYKNIASVVIYSDLPLFISANCIHANLSLCKTPYNLLKNQNCNHPPLNMNMKKFGKVTIYPQSCGSVLVADKPYCLQSAIHKISGEFQAKKMRAEFIYKKYSANLVKDIWLKLLHNEHIDGYTGNYHGKLQ